MTQTLTKGPFATETFRGGVATSHYLSLEASQHLLTEAARFLGNGKSLSWYKLGQLVGVPYPNIQPYQWMSSSPSSSCRPSAMYLTRLGILLILKAAYGWTLEQMTQINWETFGA